jgi:hypothetical protein
MCRRSARIGMPNGSKVRVLVRPSGSAQTSNKITQKELAFLGNQSGTAFNFGR